MELVKVIFGAIASSGALSLLAIVFVQLRKSFEKYHDYRTEKLRIEAIKHTNETNLKIAKESNRTALKMAEKGHHKQNDDSPSMTRAS